jgi:hypothetical protein
MHTDAAAFNEFEREEYFLKAGGHWSSRQNVTAPGHAAFLARADQHIRENAERFLQATAMDNPRFQNLGDTPAPVNAYRAARANRSRE